VRPETVVVVLSVLLLLAIGAVAALAVLLARRTRELEEVTARLTPVSDRPQNAAQWALRTVVDTATRVRERGIVSGLLRTPIEELQRWVDEERDQIVRIAGPDGALTVMFSDIEGSTALNEELGDRAWVRLLRDHDRVVRDAVARGDGHVVKSQGDGFMVVFREPDDAVRTARRIHRKVATSGRRLRRTTIAVRIGIHCGTVVARSGDFYGRNVAMAARVAALAGGGETLVTEEVRAGLDAALEQPRTSGDTRRLLADLELVDAGEVELKGLTGEHRLWLLT
jgi:class 3 adenylate cyclase